MKNRSAARKYGKVLMKIAQSDEAVEGLEKELNLFSSILSGSPAIERFFVKPVVGKKRKMSVLQEVCIKAGISEAVARFLAILIDNERMDLLDDIIMALKELRDERQNIIPIEVTTAVEMTPELKKKIASIFSSMTGKHVRLATRVDPAVIGGVVTRIGSTIYDGGMKTQLSKMKEKILGE